MELFRYAMSKLLLYLASILIGVSILYFMKNREFISEMYESKEQAVLSFEDIFFACCSIMSMFCFYFSSEMNSD
jgi:hypothetical protein